MLPVFLAELHEPCRNKNEKDQKSGKEQVFEPHLFSPLNAESRRVRRRHPGAGSVPVPMKVAYFIKPLILHKRQESDRRSKPRNNSVRPYFMKRLKDKAPLMHSRVRHNEFRRLINRAVTEKLDIEIDRPGSVMNPRGADASEIKLNFLHRVEQLFRRDRHGKHRRGIGVVRPCRVDRSCTVEAAYPHDADLSLIHI